MNNHEIIFKLNDIEKIVIIPEESLNDIHCCSEALIIFYKNSEKFKLESGMLTVNLPTLSYLLEQALKNKLPLHESIKEDIGYLYTQYTFYAYDKNRLENMGLVFDKIDDDWVGIKHLLWAGYDFAVWVYNDKNGNIMLEFTPRYKGDYFDPEDSSEFEAYNTFIKNYKSYLTTTISHNTAQQWLAQANALLKQIDDNVQRLIAEEKNKKKTD